MKINWGIFALAMFVFSIVANAKLPIRLPVEPAAGDHGAYSVQESPFDSADPAAAIVYDNFTLNQSYLINAIAWSGIFAEPIPAPSSNIDFLIEIWGSTGSGSAGPAAAPDLADRKAQFFLTYGKAAASTDGFFDVRSVFPPRSGSHTSPATGSTPGGGPAVDYHAYLNPTLLEAGTYWLSIQAVQNFDNPSEPDPEWQWHFGSATGQGGDGYQAADLTLNPSAGLGGSFVNTNTDMAFQLFGIRAKAAVDQTLGDFTYLHSTENPLQITVQSAANQNPVYAAGQYDYFALSLFWRPDSGSPLSNDIRFRITTAAGATEFLVPQLVVSDTSVAKPLVFVGRLPDTYDPDVDARVTFNFQSDNAGAQVELSKMELYFFDPAGQPVDIIKTLGNPNDVVDSQLQNAEVRWVKLEHAGGELVVDTVGSLFDAELAVYSQDGALLGADDDGAGSLQSRVVLENLSSGTYYAAVSTFNSVFSPGFYVRTISAQRNGALMINSNANGGGFCFPIVAGSGRVSVVCL